MEEINKKLKFQTYNHQNEQHEEKSIETHSINLESNQLLNRMKAQSKSNTCIKIVFFYHKIKFRTYNHKLRV